MSTVVCSVCQTPLPETAEVCSTCGNTIFKAENDNRFFLNILSQRAEIQEKYGSRYSYAEKKNALESEKSKIEQEYSICIENLEELKAKLAQQNYTLGNIREKLESLRQKAAIENDWLDYLSFTDTYLKPVSFNSNKPSVRWYIQGNQLEITILGNTSNNNASPNLILGIRKCLNNNSSESRSGTEQYDFFINLQSFLKKDDTLANKWWMELNNDDGVNLSKFNSPLLLTIQSEHKHSVYQYKIEVKSHLYKIA